MITQDGSIETDRNILFHQSAMRILSSPQPINWEKALRNLIHSPSLDRQPNYRSPMHAQSNPKEPCIADSGYQIRDCALKKFKQSFKRLLTGSRALMHTPWDFKANAPNPILPGCTPMAHFNWKANVRSFSNLTATIL